ncbi:MAG: cysteine synthase A [Gammaproteobacteria bacterium]|nr:cysteine synthase A [Gammaproteobacteria bacterium]
MHNSNNILDYIGNTPLLRLHGVSAQTGCEIYAKAEFMNPAGSIKDRTALGLVRDAQERGQLNAGGTLVEGTAGNTGIGLALVGHALGYKVVVVMPETQSQEKIDTLKANGVELHLVAAQPYSHPDNFIHVAQRLAKELNHSQAEGALWMNQFDNLANRAIHARTTGEEIWQQTEGKVDAFICSVGTGGTLAGVGDCLKGHNPNVVIALADPMGACLYHYYKHGELRAEGDSITEGIGQIRITANLHNALIDEAFMIPDAEAIPYLHQLVHEQGLCLGGSSAINIAGAVRLAKKLGRGKTIITLLGDHGSRYQQRLYNRNFLEQQNIPVADWL